MIPFATIGSLVANGRVMANAPLVVVDMAATPSPRPSSASPSDTTSTYPAAALDSRRRTSSLGQKKYKDSVVAILDYQYSCHVLCCSSRLRRWDFDIFAWSQAHGLMTHLSLHILQDYNACAMLQMDYLSLTRMLCEIETAYVAHNPYHNAVHAADVCQASYVFLRQPAVSRRVSEFECITLLLAALCHDVAHPGYNQNYIKKTDHHFNKLYDTAILEQHHVSISRQIFRTYGMHKRDWWSQFDTLFTTLVMATDMGRHGAFMADFTTAPPSSEVLLNFIIKCSDISNPARPFTVCREWSGRVCTEFYEQGDMEKKNGLEVTANCNRSDTNMAALQIGFARFLVQPLFSIWGRLETDEVPVADEARSQLLKNIASWEQIADGESRNRLRPPVSSVMQADGTYKHQSRRRASEGTPAGLPLPVLFSHPGRRCSNEFMTGLPPTSELLLS